VESGKSHEAAKVAMKEVEAVSRRFKKRESIPNISRRIFVESLCLLNLELQLLRYLLICQLFHWLVPNQNYLFR